MKKDKELILAMIEVQKMKIEREKAMVALDKSLFMYFTFLFVAIFGFINGFANLQMLNLLIILGIALLVLGSIPYLRYNVTQKNTFDELISRLKR